MSRGTGVTNDEEWRTVFCTFSIEGATLTGEVSNGTVGGDMVMSEIVVPKGDFTFEQFRALNPTFTKFRLRRFLEKNAADFSIEIGPSKKGEKRFLVYRPVPLSLRDVR